MIDARTPITSLTHGSGRRSRLAIATLGLAGGLVAGTGALSAADAAPAATATCVSASTTTDYKSAATGATTALTKALNNIKTGHYAKATRQLQVVKSKARTANRAAASLIGRPPTDPESDDLPGVAAVLKVSGLDHQITMALIPMFSNPKGQHVIPPLAKGLIRVDECRDVMLGDVIAQSPAARDDYVDGLSDTLPSYAKELSTFTAALAGAALTPAGRTALQRAQSTVSATNADMQRVFGGGERSPGLPR